MRTTIPDVSSVPPSEMIAFAPTGAPSALGTPASAIDIICNVPPLMLLRR